MASDEESPKSKKQRAAPAPAPAPAPATSSTPSCSAERASRYLQRIGVAATRVNVRRARALLDAQDTRDAAGVGAVQGAGAAAGAGGGAAKGATQGARGHIRLPIMPLVAGKLGQGVTGLSAKDAADATTTPLLSVLTAPRRRAAAKSMHGRRKLVALGMVDSVPHLELPGMSTAGDATGAAGAASGPSGGATSLSRGANSLGASAIFDASAEGHYEAANGSDDDVDPELGENELTFSDITSRFVHPFTLRDRSRLRERVAAEAARSGRGGRRPPRAPVKGASASVGDGDGGFSSNELAAELAQPFAVTREAVLSLQSDFEACLVGWHEGLAVEALRGRLTATQFKAAARELSTDATLDLFADAATLCYGLVLKPGGLAPAEQSALVYRLLERFDARRRYFHSSRSRLFFMLPMLLLSLRVLVEGLFSTAFPLWATTDEGANGLEEMDAMITGLLDPHGYHGELPLLQSTPSAVGLLRRHQRLTHPHASRHFYDTSPKLRAVLGGEPASKGARVMLARGGGALSTGGRLGPRGGGAMAALARRVSALGDGHRRDLLRKSTRRQQQQKATTPGQGRPR